MKAKIKGTAKERKAKRLLEREGWYVIRSSGSFGVFDLLCFKLDADYCLAIQVKSRYPGRKELEFFQNFQVPGFIKKQLWVFPDYSRKPIVLNF